MLGFISLVVLFFLILTFATYLVHQGTIPYESSSHEELCFNLARGYDFSGTDEAAAHNNALWRKNVSLLEEIVLELLKDDQLILIRRDHELNVKYLANNPGILKDYKFNGWNYWGLPILYK